MNEREPGVTILPPDGEGLPSQPPLEERNWAMACHLSGLLLYIFPIGHIFAPLAIWLLTNFFQNVPDEIYRAARVDGCTPFQAFYKVILPLSTPGLFATAILVFI